MLVTGMAALERWPDCAGQWYGCIARAGGIFLLTPPPTTPNKPEQDLRGGERGGRGKRGRGEREREREREREGGRGGGGGGEGGRGGGREGGREGEREGDHPFQLMLANPTTIMTTTIVQHEYALLLWSL